MCAVETVQPLVPSFQSPVSSLQIPVSSLQSSVSSLQSPVIILQSPVSTVVLCHTPMAILTRSAGQDHSGALDQSPLATGPWLNHNADDARGSATRCYLRCECLPAIHHAHAHTENLSSVDTDPARQLSNQSMPCSDRPLTPPPPLAPHDHPHLHRIHHQAHPVRADIRGHPADAPDPSRGESGGLQKCVGCVGCLGRLGWGFDFRLEHPKPSLPVSRYLQAVCVGDLRVALRVLAGHALRSADWWCCADR